MKIKLLGFLLLLFLSGCVSPEKKETPPPLVEPEMVEEGVIPPVSREAILTYGGEAPAELSLTLGGEPRLLPEGYLRLLGIINGKNTQVLLELAGRGVYLGLGEGIGAYRLKKVFADRVLLVKGGER